MKNYYTIIIIFFHWSGIFLDFYILIYFNQRCFSLMLTLITPQWSLEKGSIELKCQHQIANISI